MSMRHSVFFLVDHKFDHFFFLYMYKNKTKKISIPSSEHNYLS